MSQSLQLLAASLFMWGVGEGLFLFFEPLYLERLGASPLQIGSILGLAGAAMTLTHVPAGAIADRFGSKSVMVASWVMGTVAAGLMFAANSLAVFVVGLILYALTLFVMSPMASYITQARGGWPTARAITVTLACFYAGLILGPLAGGFLAESVELRAVYAAATVIFALSTLLVLFLKPYPPEPAPDGPRYRTMLGNAELRRFLILIFVALFALFLSWPLTPNFLETVRAVPLGGIGLLGSFNALGVVVLSFLLSRRRALTGLAVSQAVVALSVLALWLPTGFAWFAVGYFFAGGYRTASSLAIAHAEALAPRSQMGMAYGLVETVAGLVRVLAPPVAGLLFSLHPSLPFPVSLGLIVAGLGLTVALAPAGREAPRELSPAAELTPLARRD